MLIIDPMMSCAPYSYLMASPIADDVTDDALNTSDVNAPVRTSYVPDNGFATRAMAGGDDEPLRDDEGGLAVEEAKPKLKKPPLFKVILLNDDYTPMEFVVEVLEVFFKMNREQATQVMLTVHTQGKGVCGIYTRDIAETKSAQVNQFARDHQHPLLCEIEASEG